MYVIWEEQTLHAEICDLEKRQEKIVSSLILISCFFFWNAPEDEWKAGLNKAAANHSLTS